MTLQEHFKAAYSWAKRRKGLKQKAGPINEMVNLTSTVCKTELDPTHKTASWRYDAAKKRHHIKLGDYLHIMRPLVAVDSKKAQHVARMLLRHEAAHGVYSPRDLDAIARRLSAESIPYVAYNVVEDIRIEHLARQSTLGGCNRFGWRGLLNIKTETDHPLEWLNSACQHECSSYKSNSVEPHWTGISRVANTASPRYGVSSLQLLRCYYKWFTEAPDFDRELELLKQLFVDFPMSMERVTLTRGNGDVGDNTDGSYSKGSEGDGEADEAKDDSVIYDSEKTKADPKKDKGPDGGKASRHALFTKHQCPSQADIVQQLVSRTRQIVNSMPRAKLRQSTRGSRINAKRAETCSTRSFYRLDDGRKRRKLFVMVDCSGSMDSDLKHRGGIQWIQSLIHSHLQGVIDLKLVLSCSDGWWEIPPTKESFLMAPFIDTYGSEGLSTNLDHWRKWVNWADTVVIFTDGSLQDSEVSNRRWRAMGVDLIACCVGTPTSTETIMANLMHYFNRGFVGESIVNMWVQVLGYILNRGK